MKSRESAAMAGASPGVASRTEGIANTTRPAYATQRPGRVASPTCARGVPSSAEPTREVLAQALFQACRLVQEIADQREQREAAPVEHRVLTDHRRGVHALAADVRARGRQPGGAAGSDPLHEYPRFKALLARIGSAAAAA